MNAYGHRTQNAGILLEKLEAEVLQASRGMCIMASIVMPFYMTQRAGDPVVPRTCDWSTC